MLSGKTSDSISLIRKINRIARNHYQDSSAIFDHNQYLEECFECLIEFFEINLRDRYLFSALSYHKKSDNTKVELVKVKNSETPYHFKPEIKAQFEPEVKVLLRDIFDGKCMSLTLTLLDNPLGKDVFLSSGQSYTMPVNPEVVDDDVRITFFSLAALIFNQEAEIFVKLNAPEIFFFKDQVLKDKDNFDLQMIGRLLWHYKKLEMLYLEAHPGKDFFVHFIRPSFIDFDYNILLSLATDEIIAPPELLAFIDLIIYRIVGQMAIEKIKEAERLKRKKSFSLTTHSFKTTLKTTIIPNVNRIIREPKESYFATLKKQCLDLYNLTGLVSLIDKIGEEEEFIASGIKDDLLTAEPECLSISEQYQSYLSLNPSLAPIIISGAPTDSFHIQVYDVYLSLNLVRLLYNMIFENLNLYGKRTDKQINLSVIRDNKEWIFENETNVEEVEIDPAKLKGNLLLFQTLVEDTGCGIFTIESKAYKFRIIYRPGSNA